MAGIKFKILLLTSMIILYALPVLSQNFDYELQNSLERIYTNSETKKQEDFNIFRKTFFSEGYSSFDYLYKILEKSSNLGKEYPVFFHDVDTDQFDVFRKITGDMVARKKIITAWVFSVDTFVNYISDIKNLIPFIVNCFSNNYFVLFFFLIVTGILFFLRFIRLLLYDIKNNLSRYNLDYTLANYLAAFVVILAPVFLTVNFIYLPLYWLLLFFIYTTKKEKVIVYTSLVILLIVSLTGIYLTSFSKHFYRNEYYYYESLTSPFSGIADNKKTTGDFENFAKALSMLRSGNAIESIKLFKKIESDSILNKYALNNIGVAYIVLSRPKLALNFFDESTKKGLNFEPNINKFYLNNQLYNIVESEEALKAAYNANAIKTAYWLKLNVKDPLPVIAVPSFKDIAIHFLKGFKISKSRFSLKIPIFIILLLIILGVVHYFSTKLSVTKGCVRCGTPFKVFESQNDKLCTQCALLNKTKGNISGEMKEIKRREIRLYSTIKRSFEIGLGLVFPGFYNICVLQRVFSGFLIFVFFFLILLDTLKAYRVSQNLILVSPLIAILLLIYLINLLNIFFERGED